MLKAAQTAVKFFSKFLKGAFRHQTKDLRQKTFMRILWVMPARFLI